MSNVTDNDNNCHRVIITGASKGLGNNFALCYAAAVQYPIHFVLHGRNKGEVVNLLFEVSCVHLQYIYTKYIYLYLYT